MAGARVSRGVVWVISIEIKQHTQMTGWGEQFNQSQDSNGNALCEWFIQGKRQFMLSASIIKCRDKAGLQQ